MEIPPPQIPSFPFIPLIPKQALNIKRNLKPNPPNPRFTLFFKFNYHVRVQAALDREHG
jgi:hypothetical protein